jgi:hypothetical protein
VEQNENLFNSSVLKSLRNCFYWNNEKNNALTGFVSAPFQSDIKFIFEGFEVVLDKSKGFRNTTRSFLANNILQNMDFKPEEKSRYYQLKKEKNEDGESTDFVSPISQVKQRMLSLKKELLEFDDEYVMTYPGLPYLLDRKYFDDAFILHNESEGH